MGIEVKICGLTEAAGVDAAVESGADFLGFVFFPPSPRNIAVARAAALAESARGRARVVALTVDADDALIADIVAVLAPDLLQLHGAETPDRVAALRARHGIPVMKAIGVSAAADVARARDYASVADRILFDAKPPPDATRPGGLGRAFDWRLLAGVDLALPYMLSGGLDADSVGEAVRIARPQGVDVSSGVESAPGIKAPELVRGFVARLRAAEAALAAPQKERIA